MGHGEHEYDEYDFKVSRQLLCDLAILNDSFLHKNIKHDIIKKFLKIV
jgi:hypothetical protein